MGPILIITYNKKPRLVGAAVPVLEPGELLPDEHDAEVDHAQGEDPAPEAGAAPRYGLNTGIG